VDQLNAIKAFSQVVQLGSFTKAAESLGMPKTTVSKLVGSLEAHLRVKLLKRSTRTVQVTPEGAVYFERTARWLDQLKEIDCTFDHISPEPQGLVHVDLSAWTACAIVIPRLPDFYLRYPKVQVKITVSDRAAHLIRDSADCAIRSGNVTDQSMIARPLGLSRWITAATPAYLQQHGTPTHPAELRKGHVLVNHQLSGSGRAIPFIFQNDKESIHIESSSRLLTNESNAHLAAGLAGIGILYSFEWKLRPYLDDGRLVSILDDWQPPPYPFHLVYPPNRHMSTRVKVFMDWLFEVFKDLA
jgi:LysR family transcriptional regulator for bpeEF and oprC